MSKYYLHQQIGDPINMIEPQIFATDIASTDPIAGVPVSGADGIMFLLAVGDMTTDAMTVAIAYSSTGSASDAGVSSAVWAATDCTFGSIDSDGEDELYIMDINLGHKGVSDDIDGKFFGVLDDTGGGGGAVCLIGIPYNLKYYPATNANTVVTPTSTAFG